METGRQSIILCNNFYSICNKKGFKNKHYFIELLLRLSSRFIRNRVVIGHIDTVVQAYGRCIKHINMLP